MIVGYFSPMPPLKSGIADYSAALLEELRALGDVRVAPDRYDSGLYHLGNNLLHQDIYARALKRPGVVVIHDALLHHFFLGSLAEEEYVAEFVYNYGAWSRMEALSLWRDRAVSGLDARYFGRPMLKRICETSRAVIVHNAEARARVLAHAPSARIVEIPHFYVPQGSPDESAVVEFRGRARYLFGVFGYLRQSKRVSSVLNAIRRLKGAELLIAGEGLDSIECGARVRRLGHMNDAEFALATQAVDCCINLRYPSAGETSGIGVRLMGIGKPVIFTDGRENAALPAHAYLAVESGLREEAHLFEVMSVLVSKPELGRQIGTRAADHILRYHSIKAAAEQYWNLLCDVCS